MPAHQRRPARDQPCNDLETLQRVARLFVLRGRSVPDNWQTLLAQLGALGSILAWIVFRVLPKIVEDNQIANAAQQKAHQEATTALQTACADSAAAQRTAFLEALDKQEIRHAKTMEPLSLKMDLVADRLATLNETTAVGIQEMVGELKGLKEQKPITAKDLPHVEPKRRGGQ